MEERNRTTLLNALRELPQHTPPASLWKSIEGEMEFYEREASLRRSVRRLPQYAPPPLVWDHIQAELRQPRIKRLRKQMTPIRWAAAAILFLSIFSGAQLWMNHQQPQVQIAYATEPGTTPFIPVALPQDEEAIQELGTLFTRVQAQFPLPDGARLIGELEELNEASQELRVTLKKYGFDEHIAQELTRVELQRNQIIQQMAFSL